MFETQDPHRPFGIFPGAVACSNTLAAALMDKRGRNVTGNDIDLSLWRWTMKTRVAAEVFADMMEQAKTRPVRADQLRTWSALAMASSSNYLAHPDDPAYRARLVDVHTHLAHLLLF